MSTIRMRPDEDLTVAPLPAGIAAGGFVSGDANGLMAPGDADTSALKKAPTTNTESAIGALRETLAAKALRGYDYLSIPEEPGFNPAKALGPSMSQYTEDELGFLADARSSNEMAQRQTQVLATRQNQEAMAAHPVTAVAASMVDIDAVIGFGIGKMAGVARTTRMIAGLTANTAVLGLASNGGHITPLDVIGSSLGVALGAIPRVRRAVDAVEDAAAVDVKAATRTVEDTVVGPTGNTTTITRTGSDEAIAATDNVVPTVERTVADTDYTPPTPDMTTTKPFLDVRTTRKGATIQTTTSNAVAAVLAHGTELPADMRILGNALLDSLKGDADVALLMSKRGEKFRPSNVAMNADKTDIRTQIYSDAGPARTLSETVQSMTPYERSVVLHEAAHAKTAQNIAAWKAGRLADGPAKFAIDKLESLRAQVYGQHGAALKRAGLADDAEALKHTQYATKNVDEFIAQLFNSPQYRKVLQNIQIGPERQGVWSQLVEAVVEAFTGKSAANNALTETVSAFETLLNVPRHPNIKASPAQLVPEMQFGALHELGTPAQALSKVGAYINKSLSLYDAIKAVGPKAATLADQLVVDATSGSANSAAHFARTAHLAANVDAAVVEGAVVKGLSARGWNTLSRMHSPEKFKAAQRELSEQVYAQLADNHAKYREGGEILSHPDPVVQSIVDSFAKSKWAENQLERIKGSGVQGSDKVESSPYYLPRRHNGDKVSAYLRANPNVTRADVEGMYASQFTRMFADKGMTSQTGLKLGKQMLRNLEQRAAGVSGYRQHIAGMSNDDIEFAMRNAGVEEDQIAQFLDTAQKAGADSNTVRNLRARADFNMTEDYVTKSGTTIHPQMFVDKDVLGLMESYSRNMSGRIGLAKAGFPDVKSVAAAVDQAAAEGADAIKSRKLLDNTVNQVLGYPTGEDIPDILRSFSVVSGAMQLANSGIYQLADATLMIKQFGVTKVMRQLTKTAFGRNALTLAQDPAFGSKLTDVLEARNVLSGRYRSIMTHLDDNTDIGHMGVAHQMIAQMGQGTRFVNGMEFVRRGQSKMVAGLIGSTVDDVLAGDAKAAEALARFGLNDDLLTRARAAHKADPDMREWPASLRLDMETIGHNMADALVQENRLGEIPAWMQFSTLGKFVLPYMRFVAGTWNKILRRTYKQDGATGLAMMFAYQLPLTTLSSIAALSSGKKPLTPESVAANVLTQMPLMSWLGYGVNMAVQGPTNSIAALGAVDKAYSATSSIVNGNADASQLIRAVPFLSIIPGVRQMAAAMGDD